MGASCVAQVASGIGTESLERSPTVGRVCWSFLQNFTLPVSQAVPIIKCPSCSMNCTWGYVWIGPWRISRGFTFTDCLHFFSCNDSYSSVSTPQSLIVSLSMYNYYCVHRNFKFNTLQDENMIFLLNRSWPRISMSIAVTVLQKDHKN